MGTSDDSALGAEGLEGADGSGGAGGGLAPGDADGPGGSGGSADGGSGDLGSGDADGFGSGVSGDSDSGHLRASGSDRAGNASRSSRSRGATGDTANDTANDTAGATVGAIASGATRSTGNASRASPNARAARRTPRASASTSASAAFVAPVLPTTNHRIAEQPAFVLHSYPYRETSLIVDVLSRDHGRVALVAKGAKRAHSALRGVLQTFQPLSLSWSGKGEVRTLTGAEWVGGMLPLTGDALLCGFYVNELMVKFCAREDAYPGLFGHYVLTLTRLAHGEPAAQVLRSFERVLLRETGYALSLTRTAARRAVEPEGRYVFDPERGVRDTREFAGHGTARAQGVSGGRGADGMSGADGSHGANVTNGAARLARLDDGLGRPSVDAVDPANPVSLTSSPSTSLPENPSASSSVRQPTSRPPERFAPSERPALPAQWPILSGQTLLDMEADDYHRPQTLAQSKALMRFLLNTWLDGTPLATRQILIDLQNL